MSREAGAYDLGPQHPLRPERFLLTWDLIESCGLDRLAWVDRLTAHAATREELLLVHRAEYLEVVERAGHGNPSGAGAFGFGEEGSLGDNPIFPEMHEASALVAGMTLAAASAVWTGSHVHAFNAAGGMHHAMPARASGFCVYDDVAVGIAWLLAQGAERVAYVDIDVHHGDGPEAIFAEDPRVLTISIHEYGPTFFPGTGGQDLSATARNVPVVAGTGDAGWLAALREQVLPPVRAFAPDVLVTQLGCDTHATDPLASLALTTAGYREAYRDLHALAHESAGGRWVATGGGGYDWARVVPRAWTLAFAEMAGVAETLPDELPATWRAPDTGGAAIRPRTFSDPMQ